MANDELMVSTVLVQDPEQLRATLLYRIEQQATKLCAEAGDADRNWRRGGLSKDREARIRGALDDVNKCVDLLGQIGWRD